MIQREGRKNAEIYRKLCVFESYSFKIIYLFIFFASLVLLATLYREDVLVDETWEEECNFTSGPG